MTMPGDVPPMTHAEAHERLADLALEPRGLEPLLAALGGSSLAGGEPGLVAHVRSCETCRAELDAAARLDAGLRASLDPTLASDRLDAVMPPPSLRASVLGAARAARAARPAAASQTPFAAAGVRIRPRADEHTSWGTRLLPRITGPAWGTAIVALLVVALLGGVAGGRLQQLASGPSGDSLAGVVGTVERVLESPSHRVVSLRSASGAAAGSVAWSQQDFAVLTSALTPPPAGEVYRCWLAWGDQAATIGEMDFAGSTAYWTGTTGSWASVTFEPGTRFLVTLEPAASPPPGAEPGPVILQADLSA